MLSDATIAAVAMLVKKENLNGRYRLSEIHKNGLEKMIHLRGGVYALQGVFRRIVAWSDLCNATVWACQPSSSRLFPRSRQYHHLTSADTKPALLNLRHLFCANSPLVPIFKTLRLLSRSLSSARIMNTDRIETSNAIYNLELLLSKPPSTSSGPSDSVLTLEAVQLRTAAHLYLWLAIRELPPSSELVHIIAQRLLESIVTQLSTGWMKTKERMLWLLWILFVGGIAAMGRLERLSFVREMVVVCTKLQVWDKDALRDSLRLVLWQEGFAKEKLELLWLDMVHSWDLDRKQQEQFARSSLPSLMVKSLI
ncbi:hypothetical protein ONS95_005899 [Cadophora gregata]|uniref:uncharacterized protein n=1 Tax=Cadophora gregata TaxID=51156 RepID=UPI0026DD08F5|nr:uncharacterized protein ONS95_005899 [Cadophora gregata]KAK0102277.1 hypothetical protein ONS95_005899 [Cadophora gregata]